MFSYECEIIIYHIYTYIKIYKDQIGGMLKNFDMEISFGHQNEKKLYTYDVLKMDINMNLNEKWTHVIP